MDLLQASNPTYKIKVSGLYVYFFKACSSALDDANGYSKEIYYNKDIESFYICIIYNIYNNIYNYICVCVRVRASLSQGYWSPCGKLSSTQSCVLPRGERENFVLKLRGRKGREGRWKQAVTRSELSKTTHSTARTPGSFLARLLPMRFWDSYLISLSLSFLICKMEKSMVPVS